MVKILKYDNPDHKIKLKIRQFQVMGKSTGQINNIGYKWYIGSKAKLIGIYEIKVFYSIERQCQLE